MSDKPYYHEINDDNKTYDKVMLDLERMAANAPNARTRTLAQTTMMYIRTIREGCKKIIDYEEKNSKNG